MENNLLIIQKVKDSKCQCQYVYTHAHSQRLEMTYHQFWIAERLYWPDFGFTLKLVHDIYAVRKKLSYLLQVIVTPIQYLLKD